MPHSSPNHALTGGVRKLRPKVKSHFKIQKFYEPLLHYIQVNDMAQEFGSKGGRERHVSQGDLSLKILAMKPPKLVDLTKSVVTLYPFVSPKHTLHCEKNPCYYKNVEITQWIIQRGLMECNLVGQI